MSKLRPYPLGHTIIDSPHSVFVNLPMMSDVIGYEENDPRVTESLRSGYPRFLTHHYIRQIETNLLAKEDNVDVRLFLSPSLASAEQMKSFVGDRHATIQEAEIFYAIGYPIGSDACQLAGMFQQHTGTGLSSREAEDYLGIDRHPEAVYDQQDAVAKIKRYLHGIYETRSPEDIRITRGGMNAFYAGFKCLRDLQAARGRTVWVQLGWLYVDTICIISKMLPAGGRVIQLHAMDDLASIHRVFSDNADTIAGVVTETPTNPLVQSGDLDQLRQLADDHGAALMLDPSIVSPHNVNILKYSDLHINSLTKYAPPEGDVLAGAVALNADSPFYEELNSRLDDQCEPLYCRDAARLAHEIDGYSENVGKINSNTVEIAQFLEQHPGVDRVHWAYAEESRTQFEKISAGLKGPGAIISFTVNKPIHQFYDPLKMPKSPSFGSRYTMLCPFMYMAHYDLVSQEQGRKHLQEVGISPDLIRLSVGTDDAEVIKTVLDEALR
jgi:cystathionine gamma-synthase